MEERDNGELGAQLRRHSINGHFPPARPRLNALPSTRAMATKDEQRLKELGYDQELQRGWGLLYAPRASFLSLALLANGSARPLQQQFRRIVLNHLYLHRSHVSSFPTLPLTLQSSLRGLERLSLPSSNRPRLAVDAPRTLFSYGLTTGGPAVMTIGWLVVCFFSQSDGTLDVDVQGRCPFGS
jgi:hypothetical protein